MITIGKPYIISSGNKAKLISEIEMDGVKKKVFYEVDSEYEKYLCFETADSFLVALLHFAMEQGQDIKSDAPISSKLYYQLNNHLIPTFAKYLYKKPIKIIADINTEEIERGKAVGTGLSSGVDSFHTISSHINLDTPEFNITHLTFFNVGSHGTGEKSKKLYVKRLKEAKKVAQDLGFDLIEINSNIHEHIKVDFTTTHTLSSFSAVLALQKFFSKYYYATGYPLDEFAINSISSYDKHDLLNAFYISTELTQFYSSGIEKSRLDKIKKIVEYEPSQRHLEVCFKDSENCGSCEKCIRTQLGLYSIGKLDLYKDVFDLKKFDSMKNSNLGFMLANKNNSFYPEIIQEMKNHGYKIPAISYIYFIKHKAVNITKILSRPVIKELQKSEKLVSLVRRRNNNNI